MDADRGEPEQRMRTLGGKSKRVNVAALRGGRDQIRRKYEKANL
jgi:hypothetical protein